MDAGESVQMRDALIEAALPHVAFDGWTMTALRHGAAEAGLDLSQAARVFPGGGRDMVAHFSALSDRRMLESLDRMDLPSMGVTERVRTAVRVRLEQAEPHREAIRRTLAFLWYSKRGMLAGVVGATVLFWLNDTSEGCTDTWDFLDRRLADVARFGKATGKMRSRLKDAAQRPFRPRRASRH
jgi:ubiquinone biosynthesis protein COQ9